MASRIESSGYQPLALEDERRPATEIPNLVGVSNALRNFAEMGRLPSLFHCVRHYMNVINDDSTTRAGIIDVMREIIDIACKLFRSLYAKPSRYADELPENCGLVNYSEPFHPLPILNFDVFLLIKTLHITGIFDTKLMREIMRKNRQLDSQPIVVCENYKAIGKLTDPSEGDGRAPFSAKNEAYQKLRRFLREQLMDKKLSKFGEIFNQMLELTEDVVNTMGQCDDGIVKDVTKATFSLPSNVIQCVLFGKVIPGLDEKMYEMTKYIRLVMGTLGSDARAKQIKASEDYQYLKELMQEVWETPDEYPGLLSAMRQQYDQEGREIFDRDDLFATLLFLLSAGEDTLSSAISSAIHELGSHDDIQERLYNALKPYYEREEKIGIEELDRIPELDQAVKEVLRLYPSLPILVREVNPGQQCPFLLNSSGDKKQYALDKTRSIWMFIFESHRDSAYWDRAEEFIPERWDKGKMREYGTKPINFLSFGHGPNRCVGENIARVEIKAMIYTLVKQYRFKTVKNNYFQAGIALSPSVPIEIQLSKRE